MHHKNTVRINVYLAKYSRYQKSRYFSTRIRVNELSNLNKNTQNLSILVCYANFYVKNLRTNNDKMTQFHWSRKSRDSCPTSSGSTAFVMFLVSFLYTGIVKANRLRISMAVNIHRYPLFLLPYFPISTKSSCI